MSSEITLRFGLTEGRNANAVVAAQSLLAWVDLVQEAARAIDPSDSVVVELLGTTEGSLKLVSLIKKVDQGIGTIRSGASDYPNLKAMAVGLAISTATAVVGAGIGKAFQDPTQKVELSESDRDLLKGYNSKVETSAGVQNASKRLLQTVEQDPAITEVTVSEGGELLVEIPRAEFPERGGLWEMEDVPPAERTTRDVWDVVLLKAPFVRKPRRWTFLRDGIPFSARMEDSAFLQAISEGRVPIALQEGVMMRLEVEFKERQEGQVWIALDNTRRVVRVVQPLPLISPLTPSSSPKKD